MQFIKDILFPFYLSLHCRQILSTLLSKLRIISRKERCNIIRSAWRQIGISRNLLNHVAKTYSKIVVTLVVEETNYFCFYATDRECVFIAAASRRQKAGPLSSAKIRVVRSPIDLVRQPENARA